MAVLSLKDWRVRSVRQYHPLLARTPVLGSGQFCRVFESADPTRVLKLTADGTHVAYLTDGMSPSGRYKPIVLEDHGEVAETSNGDPVYLLEVERLQKIKRGTTNARVVRKLLNFLQSPDSWAGNRHELPTCEEQVSGLPSDLYEFMDELNMFIGNFACSLDAHGANFMERADGTLVFSDPVADYRLMRRSERHRAA